VASIYDPVGVEIEYNVNERRNIVMNSCRVLFERGKMVEQRVSLEVNGRSQGVLGTACPDLEPPL
jgi:hypothetical protein